MKFPSTPPSPVSPHHRSTGGFCQSSQSAGEPHTSISKVTSIALNPVLKKKLFYDTVVTKEVVEKSMAIISFKFKHPLSSLCVLVCIWLQYSNIICILLLAYQQFSISNLWYGLYYSSYILQLKKVVREPHTDKLDQYWLNLRGKNTAFSSKQWTELGTCSNFT